MCSSPDESFLFGHLFSASLHGLDLIGIEPAAATRSEAASRVGGEARLMGAGPDHGAGQRPPSQGQGADNVRLRHSLRHRAQTRTGI